MNGCHSTLAPMNRKHKIVELPKYKGYEWEYRFTRNCQYDNKNNDIGCNGCKEKKANNEQPKLSIIR